MTDTSIVSTCEPRYATARTVERKTLGGAAAKVAKVLGHPLMPWQRRVLDVALELGDDGRLVYRDVTLSVPRQQGKSYLLLVLMLTRGLLEPRESIVYTAQSGLDARKKVIDDWAPMVRASPLGSQATLYLAPGRESLTLTNGSQVALIASTAKAGHGRVIDLAILDEAFAYADARTEQALRPAQMTRPNPQIWVVSTAGTPEGSPYLLERVERGRLAVDAGTNQGLCFFEWSASEDDDPADPETWRSCMPALGFTVSEAAVRSAQLGMGRREFARAYTNVWTSTLGESIVALETWEGLLEADAPRPETLILGVDVSPRSKSAAIAAAGVHNGYLIVSVLEHGPGTEWLAPRLEALKGEMGGALTEILGDRRALAAVWDQIECLDVTPVDTAEAAESCSYFLDVVERGLIRHRGEKELTVALDGAALRPLGDSFAWSRKQSGVDISPLCAVTAAVFGWRWDGWAGDNSE